MQFQLCKTEKFCRVCVSCDPAQRGSGLKMVRMVNFTVRGLLPKVYGKMEGKGKV